jgi:hypothetical protein
MAWLRLSIAEAYRNPRDLALQIRRDIRKVWAA